MKTTFRLHFVLPALLALATLNSALSTALAQGAAFTYQGQLSAGGAPAGGSFDFVFALFDNSEGGTQLGPSLTNSAVAVTNGLFTTTLDFGGGIFTGANCWLDISVETNNTGPYTELAPRQPVTPAPYSIFANTAGNLPSHTVLYGARNGSTGLPLADTSVTNGLASLDSLAALSNAVAPRTNAILTAPTNAATGLPIADTSVTNNVIFGPEWAYFFDGDSLTDWTNVAAGEFYGQAPNFPCDWPDRLLQLPGFYFNRGASNWALSGMTAFNRLTNFQAGHGPPLAAPANTVLFYCCGDNDVTAGSAAPAVVSSLSNYFRLAANAGYYLVALTENSNATWDAAQNSNWSTVQAWVRTNGISALMCDEASWITNMATQTMDGIVHPNEYWNAIIAQRVAASFAFPSIASASQLSRVTYADYLNADSNLTILKDTTIYSNLLVYNQINASRLQSSTPPGTTGINNPDLKATYASIGALGIGTQYSAQAGSLWVLGNVTAASFSGSGAGLTGIGTQSNLVVAGESNSAGLAVTGWITNGLRVTTGMSNGWAWFEGPYESPYYGEWRTNFTVADGATHWLFSNSVAGTTTRQRLSVNGPIDANCQTNYTVYCDRVLQAFIWDYNGSSLRLADEPSVGSTNGCGAYPTNGNGFVGVLCQGNNTTNLSWSCDLIYRQVPSQ
jgi:hypothetical protein